MYTHSRDVEENLVDRSSPFPYSSSELEDDDDDDEDDPLSLLLFFFFLYPAWPMAPGYPPAGGGMTYTTSGTFGGGASSGEISVPASSRDAMPVGAV